MLLLPATASSFYLLLRLLLWRCCLISLMLCSGESDKRRTAKKNREIEFASLIVLAEEPMYKLVDKRLAEQR